jgi:hypothetical protein
LSFGVVTPQSITFNSTLFKNQEREEGEGWKRINKEMKTGNLAREGRWG